ncbi:P-loop NTPase fold protein [Exiguobacterium indicum]|uniref:P-loop NTPase fold protein n=1 Tax=Exiguobacterium indicum TaxID=296995 RepID=A0ABU8ELE8_9BACL
MGNVILVNSGKTSGEGSNFNKTIGTGVDLSETKGYVTRETYDSLKEIYGDRKTYIWGFKQKAKLDQTKVGDYMWFCSNNRYHTLAEVVYVEQENKGLSTHLWGTGEYPYIVFVNTIAKTDVTRAEVQGAVGLKAEYNLFSAHHLDPEKSEILISGHRLETILDDASKNIEFGSGEDGDSDSIAKEDKLGREVMIDKLADFYRDFSIDNRKPIFMGIFAGWGKGKSSFIEMFSSKLRKNDGAITHVVTKIDTSLMDKKDTVWLSILTTLIKEIEQEKSKDKTLFKDFLSRFTKFNSIKTQFDLLNIKKILKIKRGIIGLYIFLIASAYLLLDPARGVSLSDGKDFAGWITLGTLFITFAKTIEFKMGDVLIPSSDSKVKSSYFKSKNEFNQLVKILNSSIAKGRQLRILVILDEIDRMNKSMMSELVDVIQQFKGLQDDTQGMHRDRSDQDDEESPKVTFDFLFSFNHEIVFPSIGKEVSLGSKDSLVDSYERDMISRYDDKSIDTFQLGKEYMDKYLDVSLYLDEEMDMELYIDNLYGSITKKDVSDVGTGDGRLTEEKADTPTNSTQSNSKKTRQVTKEKDRLILSSRELAIIQEECKRLRDPRKALRLKNALIILKMVNEPIDMVEEQEEKYFDEFRLFVQSFLGRVPKAKDENVHLKYTKYFLGKNTLSDEDEGSKKEASILGVEYLGSIADETPRAEEDATE